MVAPIQHQQESSIWGAVKKETIQCEELLGDTAQVCSGLLWRGI